MTPNRWFPYVFQLPRKKTLIEHDSFDYKSGNDFGLEVLTRIMISTILIRLSRSDRIIWQQLIKSTLIR